MLASWINLIRFIFPLKQARGWTSIGSWKIAISTFCQNYLIVSRLFEKLYISLLNTFSCLSSAPDFQVCRFCFKVFIYSWYISLRSYPGQTDPKEGVNVISLTYWCRLRYGFLEPRFKSSRSFPYEIYINRVSHKTKTMTLVLAFYLDDKPPSLHTFEQFNVFVRQFHNHRTHLRTTTLIHGDNN